MSVQAAGFVYTAEGRILLLKRHDGTWGIVAGKTESGETPIQTAMREATEEIGSAPEGKLLWSLEIPRTDNEQGEFVAFAVRVDKEFEPTLNSENTDWGWFRADALPSPLFPGTGEVLDRFTADLGVVCRKMAEGKYTSPQRFMNVTLFAMRISGTGWAYRDGGRDEYAYRDRDIWLTPRVLEACQGLPVVIDHPETQVMTDQFYADRVVGSVVYPYVKDKELWGIVRIQNNAVAEQLANERWSTSPGVLTGRDSEKREVGKDGTKAVLEGMPLHPDHLAIVPAGVWDKYKTPSGIDSVVNRNEGGSAVAKLTDAITEACDTMRDRCDSGRKDAEEKGNDQSSAFFAKLLEQVDKIKGLIDGASTAAKDGGGEEKPLDEKSVAEELMKIGREIVKHDGAPMPSSHIPGEALVEQTGETEKPGTKPLDGDALAEELERIAKDACMKKDAKMSEKDHKDAEEKAAAEKAERDRKDAEEKSERDRKDKKDALDGDSLAAMVAAMKANGADEEKIRECIKMCGGDPDEYVEGESEKDREIRERLDELNKRDEEDRKKIDEIEARSRPLTDEEHNEISEVAAQTDAVASALGSSAPRYVPGEGVLAYRNRCLAVLKPHSKAWAGVDTSKLPADVFDLCEQQVRNDARAAASRPAVAKDGGALRTIRRTMPGGQTRVDTVGSFKTAYGSFMA